MPHIFDIHKYYCLMRRTLYIFFWMFLPFAASAGPIVPVVAMGVEVRPGNVSCSGMQDGSFQVTLISNGGVVLYEWSSLAQDTLGGIGTLSGNSPSDLLDSLPPGDYMFRVINLNGADTIFGASIVEPPPLGGHIHVLSDYSGFGVACMEGPGTGRVRAQIVGGTKDYSYSWSTGATGPLAVNLPPGEYDVSVSDANGCYLELVFSLDAPPPLSADVVGQAEACLGQHSGAVLIPAVGGGIPPYTMTLESDAITGVTAAWDSLAPGFYTIEIKDSHGCLLEKEVEIGIGPAFEFSTGPDTALFSGDTLPVTISSDRVLSEVQWTPASGFLKDTATGVTLLFPFTSTEYSIRVRDENGCLSMDTLRITVHRNRALYFPNVFAPNGNNVENQYFSAFSDAGVRTILLLRIFDRHGRLWFDKSNFPANSPDAGWRGEASGEAASSGVYFWQAVVLFTDEREEIFQGDVTLIR